MATYANVGIFDRSFGYGHTNGSVTETVYDISGTPSNTVVTPADSGSGNTNPYAAPAFFGAVVSDVTTVTQTGYAADAANSANSNAAATPTYTQTSVLVTGAQGNVGVVGDGSFDRSWGNGDKATGYNGKAGAASQSAHFSSGTINADGTWNSNVSNYTTGSNTDNGATAPKYAGTGARATDTNGNVTGATAVGTGYVPAKAYDFSSIIDRTSGWGHTNGAGTTIDINNPNTSNGNGGEVAPTPNVSWPPVGQAIHD